MAGRAYQSGRCVFRPLLDEARAPQVAKKLICNGPVPPFPAVDEWVYRGLVRGFASFWVDVSILDTYVEYIHTSQHFLTFEVS